MRSLIAVVIAVVGAAATAPSLTAFVDPYIGTGGGGYGVSEVPIAPQVPFGAVRLGPDTSAGLEPLRVGFDNAGGYSNTDTYVEAFSHTHVDGAGACDWKNFGVTVVRALRRETITNAGYRSAFTHDGQQAVPGYYAVNLLTPNTYAEVTVSGGFSGMHRYTCRPTAPEAPQPCVLILDICHVALRRNGADLLDYAKACKDAEIVGTARKADGSVTIQARVLMDGMMTGRGALGGVHVYFSGSVSAANGAGTALPLNVSHWEAFTLHDAPPVNGTASTSQSLGIAVWAPAPEHAGSNVVFTVRAGISFLSAAAALRNLEAEQRSAAAGAWLSFEQCRAKTDAAWEALLGRFAIAHVDRVAATERDRLVVFYTAVYHAHMSPTVYTEANGCYLGFDQRTHCGEGRHVSDLSLWDTYRTHGPLMALSAPDMARDTTNSMTAMYTHSGGHYPKWAMANVETGSMVGHHGVVTATDNIVKGVGGIDVAAAFAATVDAIAQQNRREGIDRYGFTPLERDHKSGAVTLDYAIDAAAVLNAARYLGNATVAAQMRNASQAYRNVWDPRRKIPCGRYANGTFRCPEDIYADYPLFEQGYVEGNAGQYRWYVPQDMAGLVSLFDSPDDYARTLDQYVADSYVWPFNTTLPNLWFWAGNEPCLLNPVQFNAAGNGYAYMTQAWFPQVLDTYYFAGPAGIPGNDDYGAMSSWVVWGYLGIYPVASTVNFTIFAPRFDDMTVSVAADAMPASPWRKAATNGTAVLRIIAHGRPPQGKTAYVVNASLNGVPLVDTFFSVHDLVPPAGAGASRLEVFLGDEPTVFGQAPPSRGGPRPRLVDEFMARTPSAAARKRAADVLRRPRKL